MVDPLVQAAPLDQLEVLAAYFKSSHKPQVGSSPDAKVSHPTVLSRQRLQPRQHARAAALAHVLFEMKLDDLLHASRSTLFRCGRCKSLFSAAQIAVLKCPAHPGCAIITASTMYC